MLNLISVTATLIDKDFSPFYNTFIPMMTEILTNIGMTSMPQKMLRAKAIGTIGFMIESVSEMKSSFSSSVMEITNYLVNLLNSGLQTDDPQSLAIKETLTKIASFLKEDFSQYMPNMLQNLLNDSKLDIDIILEDAVLSRDSTSNMQSLTFKMKGFDGEQKLSMNTTALESKICAFKLLSMISENAGKSFAPFSEAILPVAVENL